jgi:hypothetical protein
MISWLDIEVDFEARDVNGACSPQTRGEFISIRGWVWGTLIPVIVNGDRDEKVFPFPFPASPAMYLYMH